MQRIQYPNGYLLFGLQLEDAVESSSKDWSAWSSNCTHKKPLRQQYGEGQTSSHSKHIQDTWEYIMRKALDDWHEIISIVGKKITNLGYADDTTLIAVSEEEMLDLLNWVETESNNCGLLINAEKTKILRVDRSNTLQ